MLGLAIVREWQDGYFSLDGFSPEMQLPPNSPARATPIDHPEISLANLDDARDRIIASIVRRRGQAQFRQELLEAYQHRCALTGCDAVEALEAAHIIPYRGEHTNVMSNGLLLRCDIHTLFDLGLLTIESRSMTVVLDMRLLDTSYGCLAGQSLRVPNDPRCRPSCDLLDAHRLAAGL